VIDYANMPPSRQPEGTFPNKMQQPPTPLYPGDRPITAKENWLRIYRGEKPSWLPIYLVDNQYCWPDVVLEHPKYEVDGFDWFGTEWVTEPNIMGQMPKPGTRVITDITKWREEVTFPDLGSVEWEEDAKLQTARYDPGRPHLFHCSEGLFERLHELMPMDDTMLAMAEEPEHVHDFFAAMVSYKIELIGLVFKHYDPVDYIIWADDWGTARAGFFSNKMFRELIMPHTAECWDWIHSQGKFIELHSCGLSQQYIEEFVEMGLDAWTPQSINDIDALTKKYADRIAFTVWLPEIEAAKSEKEAREYIRKFVDKYAPRGKIIAGPIMNTDENIRTAALNELYNYSSEFYAKK